MITAAELAIAHHSSVEIPAVPDAPITDRTRNEFRILMGLVQIRALYNDDKTVTFVHRAESTLKSPPHYFAVDLATGWTGGQNNGFGEQLRPDITTLLRHETARINDELKHDPRPNKLITPDVRRSYLRARDKGKITFARDDNGSLSVRFRREIPVDSSSAFKVEYADINVGQGIIMPTESVQEYQPLHQMWWELVQEDVARAAS